MKIKAFILLLHLLVYVISGFAAVNCGTIQPVKTSCCKRMMVKHQFPEKCPKPTKNNTGNCYNCPLLYIATLAPAITVSVQSVLVKKEFRPLQNGKLTRFPSAVWKPPNVIQVSFEFL